MPTSFNGGVHTISRAEAMNAFIKKAMIGRYTLVNLFGQILNIERRVIKSSREVLNDSEIIQNVNNPLLNDLRLRFSKWAFEQMLY